MAGNGMRDYPVDKARDPLRNALDGTHEALFRRWSNAADGFGHDAVVAVAANMLVNAMRQCYASRADAERRFDELFGQAKQKVLNCYDATTGKRLNIFPHTQHVHAAHVDARDDIKKT